MAVVREEQRSSTRPFADEVHRRARTRSRSILRLVPLLALWLLPVVVAGVAVPLAGIREEGSVAAPLPSSVTVGSETTDYRTSVMVAVAMEPAGEVRSPVSGLVTSIAEVDGPLVSGRELFTVDGVPVLVQHGTLPFHRALDLGDEGEDVEALERFLMDAGFLDGESADGTFGPRVREAVRGLQESLGVEPDGVFQPGYVAFVPESVGALGEPLTAVGRTVALGDPVFATAQAPGAIRFTPAGASGSLAGLEDGPLTLSFGDLEIGVAGLDLAPEDIGDVFAGLEAAVASGAAQVMAGADGEPTQYSGGVLRRTQSEVRGMVPGTSVHVSPTGEQCLFRQDGDGSWDAVPVPAAEPAMGILGAVYVDTTFVDMRVARDPLLLPDNVLEQCG
ncbi:MAG TPA: peptidoglycan-binding domain-containing protein [Brevibacterium sp.]|nr:peptidoglycan-binding domain-containing protein [Brevibacterium sp.]